MNQDKTREPTQSDRAVAQDYERLKDHLAALKCVVVAYSGGVDSSLLLAAAHDALGEKALAVTACSATYPAHERQAAVSLARSLGARHRLIESHELQNPTFCSNPPDRCYHCKGELFRELRDIAAEEGATAVLDGANDDDRADFRPGRQAGRELGVRSPLLELGFGKDAIRRMARFRGLPNWEQPACACLASRIPYGEEINAERLNRIGAVETLLRELGFRVLRLRDHGTLARLEVGADEIERAASPQFREQIVAACKTQGFVYVCLDLAGYRTGAMNEAVPLEEIAGFREITPS